LEKFIPDEKELLAFVSSRKQRYQSFQARERLNQQILEQEAQQRALQRQHFQAVQHSLLLWNEERREVFNTISTEARATNSDYEAVDDRLRSTRERAVVINNDINAGQINLDRMLQEGRNLLNDS
jgi:hypothetical protein